jgi:hypothetical protein
MVSNGTPLKSASQSTAANTSNKRAGDQTTVALKYVCTTVLQFEYVIAVTNTL